MSLDLVDMGIEAELVRATLNLPDEIAGPMLAAFEEGRFAIGAGRFESELAVCPIVAAAKTVGIWVRGRAAAGGLAWGTENEMSPVVENFVGWFDLCAEDEGLDAAIGVVRWSLDITMPLQHRLETLAAACR